VASTVSPGSKADDVCTVSVSPIGFPFIVHEIWDQC
jgi:hypothetical protein